MNCLEHSICISLVLFISFYWNDDTHCFFKILKTQKKGLLIFFWCAPFMVQNENKRNFGKKSVWMHLTFVMKFSKNFFQRLWVFWWLFVTLIKHLGPKISITIKIYTLIRAESLCSFCYEIPCNIQKSFQILDFPFWKTGWYDKL